MFCEHCGTINSDAVNFCGSCGKKLTGQQTAIEGDTHNKVKGVKSLIRHYDKPNPKPDGVIECTQEQRKDVKSIIQQFDRQSKEWACGPSSIPEQKKEETATPTTAEESQVELRRQNVCLEETATLTTAEESQVELRRQNVCLALSATEEQKPRVELRRNIKFAEETASEEVPDEKPHQKRSRKAKSIISHFNEVFGAAKQLLKESIYPEECPEDKAFLSMAGREDLRILLVGHTGHGKSSTGNTLLGKEEFKHGLHHASITKTSHRGVAHRFGRQIDVIDTPGFFDTSHDDTFVKQELMKCVGLTLPGFNAIFLVLQPTRFSEEIESTVDLFFDFFGEGVGDYAYVILTHVRNDQQKKQYFGLDTNTKPHSKVDELLHRFKGKTLFIDNEADIKTRTRMVWNILNEIDETTAKLTVPYFTNNITEKTEKIALKLLENESQEWTNIGEVILSCEMETTTMEEHKETTINCVSEVVMEKYPMILEQNSDDNQEVASERQHAEVLEQQNVMSPVPVDKLPVTSVQQNKSSVPRTVETQTKTSEQQNATPVPRAEGNKQEKEPDHAAILKTQEADILKPKKDTKQKEKEISSQLTANYEAYKRLLEDERFSHVIFVQLLDKFCPKLPIFGRVCAYFLKKVFKKGQTKALK